MPLLPTLEDPAVSLTAESLRTRRSKDLAQIAKRFGIFGWHTMRKEELVHALLQSGLESLDELGENVVRPNGTNREPSLPAGLAHGEHASRLGGSPEAVTAQRRAEERKAASESVRMRLRELQKLQGRAKDLSPGAPSPQPSPKVRGSKPRSMKDRLILMVRDPYWLEANWELRHESVRRAEAALGHYWHAAVPVLQLFAVEGTSPGGAAAAERLLRTIQVHGGTCHWYLDVPDPPARFRVQIGYEAPDGKFFCLAKSNSVATPAPGSVRSMQVNWLDLAEEAETIYARSNGYSAEGASAELREVLSERLRRPLNEAGTPRFRVGAERNARVNDEFFCEVEAEMILFGVTRPDAHVTLRGEPVELRDDGSFTVRLAMPDKRQVVPVVAASPDGHNQRTALIAVEKSTKRLEVAPREAREGGS